MKTLPRTKKIDIRVNPLFLELLQRIQRDIPQMSKSDILSVALGKYVAGDWRYHSDENMFNLAQKLQDIHHVKKRGRQK